MWVLAGYLRVEEQRPATEAVDYEEACNDTEDFDTVDDDLYSSCQP